MTHVDESPPVASKTQRVVASIGFWLFVPTVAAFLVSVALRSFVSEKLSLVGTAALVYAIFTLIMLTRNPNQFVRIALTLMNFAMILVFGYFQWQALAPKTWPAWTVWIGAGLAGVLWLVVGYLIISRIGTRGNSAHSRPAKNGHVVAEQIKSGEITADIREQIMAAIKLSTSKGDLSVDAGELIHQLGLQSVTKDRESRASMANSMMDALRSGIFDDADKPAVRTAIRALYEISDEALEDGHASSPHQPKALPARKKIKTIEWD